MGFADQKGRGRENGGLLVRRLSKGIWIPQAADDIHFCAHSADPDGSGDRMTVFAD